MTAPLKQTAQILGGIGEVTLKNHGFSPVNAMQKFIIPKAVIPKAREPDKLVIRDPHYLKQRLRKIKREGLENFKIISDFDQTLTRSMHMNQRVQASLGIIRHSNLMSEETKENIEEGFREYKRIGKLLGLNKLEKAKELNKCMINAFEKIISNNLTIDNINEMLKESFIIPRDQLDSFLQLCSKYEIPFYTISAGISNIIASVLINYVDLETYPNFFIYSNEMLFNEEGKLVDFSKPYIHSYTKDDIFKKHQSYRKNHLIIGDLLHDVLTTKNIYPRLLTSVGYLNYVKGYDIENVLYDYARKYDVVNLSDESMILPEMITRFILDLESEQSLFNYLDQHTITIKEGKAHLYKSKEIIDLLPE